VVNIGIVLVFNGTLVQNGWGRQLETRDLPILQLRDAAGT